MDDEEKGFVLSIVRGFHKNIQRIDKKDINQYKTIQELQDMLSTLGDSKSEKREKIKRVGTRWVGGKDYGKGGRSGGPQDPKRKEGGKYYWDKINKIDLDKRIDDE